MPIESTLLTRALLPSAVAALCTKRLMPIESTRLRRLRVDPGIGADSCGRGANGSSEYRAASPARVPLPRASCLRGSRGSWAGGTWLVVVRVPGRATRAAPPLSRQPRLATAKQPRARARADAEHRPAPAAPRDVRHHGAIRRWCGCHPAPAPASRAPETSPGPRLLYPVHLATAVDTRSRRAERDGERSTRPPRCHATARNAPATVRH